jgi:hypothetical protein
VRNVGYRFVPVKGVPDGDGTEVMVSADASDESTVIPAKR